MPRLTQPFEYNKFIGGLNTDTSPLTGVPNTSISEQNFVLNIDGSRRRRLGMDYEDGFTKITTSVSGSDNPAVTSYKWKNAGGIADKSLLVVQVGTEIKIYDLETLPISGQLLYTYVFSSASDNQNFSYATVDGILIVASGIKTVTGFVFTAPNTITQTSSTLYIRDFFGVADVISSVDLFDGTNIQVRPSTKTDAHIYNLRNQTFGVPRILNSGSAPADSISDFFTVASVYPSNSDNLNEFLYPDPNNATNKTVDRFWATNMNSNSLGTEKAPSGYFIIDALTRGTSRLAKVQANNTQFSVLGNAVTSLPTDTTPGGPTVVAGFAGRVFYAGFSGDLSGGDALSPHMSSYVLFSININSVNDIGRCYQVGDPTSKETPDLIATDGGFLRIDGAYGIKAMVPAGDSLIVLATNGIWSIIGGNEYGFSATNYKVNKISDHGVSSSDSVVSVDGTVMFWGLDAIYHVHVDQTGSWVVDNISTGRIQTLFDSIPLAIRGVVRGEYDSYDRKVKWLYYNNITDTNPTQELTLDIPLKAFYTFTLGQLTNGAPKVVGYIHTEPYVVTRGNTTSVHEIAYITMATIVPVIYTFSYYKDLTFVDFKSENGVGVDAAAYLITSNFSRINNVDDYQRSKSVPYVTCHFNRTEDGFMTDPQGSIVPINQSSCFLRAMWDWSNSTNSNRWSNPQQVYRYRRLYIPADVNDPYDTGFSTIVTRNKLRGWGVTLSLYFYTEPLKDCHLYGWGLIMSMNDNV